MKVERASLWRPGASGKRSRSSMTPALAEDHVFLGSFRRPFAEPGGAAASAASLLITKLYARPAAKKSLVP